VDGFATDLGERLFRLRHLAGVGVSISPSPLERTCKEPKPVRTVFEAHAGPRSPGKVRARQPIDPFTDRGSDARAARQPPVACSRRDLIEPAPRKSKLVQMTATSAPLLR
jgi:hypothetical protein